MGVIETLWQDKTWTDGTGRTWELEDMEPRHQRNVLAFLWRHRERLEFMDAMDSLFGPMAPRGEMAAAEIDAGIAERTPEEFLDGCPLVIRLRELTGET